MFKINEFNQGGPELPEGSVTVPEPPGPEVLQATTSGVGVSKSPRKTTTIYTRRKTKTRTTKNPRRKWEKSEYMNALECLLRAEEKGVKKGIGKIVHDLWIEMGMWEIDEKNLMNQIRMIKSKGWVTNIEIEAIRRKIENEGRDEVNEGTIKESDNTADFYDEKGDINHADSANEEPIRIVENVLSESERDRLLRLREALEGDDFGKTEVNLKYGDKEKIKEEVIKMNKVLEHVKITGFTHYRNVIQAAMRIVGEELGMNKSNAKKKKEPFWKRRILRDLSKQALNTNSVRTIYHKDVSNKCRLRGTHVENVLHIVSGCSMLAQKEYKRRHDKVCLNIHWALRKKYGVKVCERWYEHKVESVIENDIVEILWDVCIQVDRQIEHRRPDIVVMEKNTNKCLIIDVACPVDNNLILKRNEKLDNYSELRLEIARMWDKETLIVPIIIGALGSIPNDLECNLKKCRNFTEVCFTRNCQHSKKSTIH